MKSDEKQTNQLKLLLPELLDRNKKVFNEVSNKIKINSFFSTNDHRANSNLKKMIRFSNERFYKVKNGEKIKNVFSQSNNDLNEMFKKIINDNLFFHNIELNNEKKKLFRNNNYGSQQRISNILKYLRKILKPKEYKLKQASKKIKALSQKELAKYEEVVDYKLNRDLHKFNNSLKIYLKNVNWFATNHPNYIYNNKRKFFINKNLDLLYYKKKNKSDIILKDQEGIDMLKIYKLKTEKEKNLIKNSSNDDLFLTKNNKPDFKDTVDLMKKMANKSLENLKIKKKFNIISNLIDLDLPKLNEYDKIIKIKKNQINNNKNDDKKNLILNLKDDNEKYKEFDNDIIQLKNEISLINKKFIKNNLSDCDLTPKIKDKKINNLKYLCNSYRKNKKLINKISDNLMNNYKKIIPNKKIIKANSEINIKIPKNIFRNINVNSKNNLYDFNSSSTNNETGIVNNKFFK
jgi:hypothetical protein